MQKYVFLARNRKKRAFLYFFLMKVMVNCKFILIFANWKLQTLRVMANKRNLKRAINSICEVLLSETVAASLYGNEKSSEGTDALLYSILRLQLDYVSRISHVEPGMSPKKYFRNLKQEFTAEADAIIDQINNM